MPEITVSEGLYRQLRAAAGSQADEDALWKMVYHFKRQHAASE
ncbi:hypothetical protein ACOZ4I_03940 [Haloarcula salina]